MSREQGVQYLLRLGFTLVLLGYLVVWLPQPVAGLSFIGLEIGEWVKFLPQVRAGQIVAGRDLFYLPPITLGILLALWTTDWSRGRWKSWAMRALAVLVAMLSFPAIEAILQENTDQWLGRLLMILFVAAVAMLAPLLNRLPGELGLTVAWIIMIVVALAGMLLPTWAYLAVRPAVAQLLNRTVGIGPGVWLNGLGHFLVVVAAVLLLVGLRRRQRLAQVEGVT